MRRAYTIGAPSIFVNKNGLGRYPEFRDQGVGGSNPLSPTNTFQSLTILATRENEPLVRLLWVPQLKCPFPKRLAPLGHRRLGHPIGAPIRILLIENQAMCRNNAGLTPIRNLISWALIPWRRTRVSDDKGIGSKRPTKR